MRIDAVTDPTLDSPQPHDWTREFFGAEQASIYASSSGSGALHERVFQGLDVDVDADIVVEKTASSAFFPGRCGLPDVLTERGIDTVLITGTVTNVCCESSARDAATLGYRVIMIADANTTVFDAWHNATLTTI